MAHFYSVLSNLYEYKLNINDLKCLLANNLFLYKLTKN